MDRSFIGYFVFLLSKPACHFPSFSFFSFFLFQVCSDQSGLSVIDGIEVVVLNRPFSERYGVEFLLQFQSDVVRQRRVLLVQLISSLFGDATPGNVVLKSIERNHVTWYNKTLSYANCQDSRVQWIIERLSMSDEASAKELREHFSPLAAVLTSSNIAVKGVCVHTTPFPTDDDDHISSGGEDEDRHNNNSKNKNYIFHGIIPSVDYLMTFLIPAMAITLMLLLAIVLACVLHKKRRAGKLNLFYSEALPPRVPVILQDELVEDLNLVGSVHSSCYGDEDIFFKILKWLFFFRCEGASAVLQC